jgi:hypothetical protein
MRRSPFPRECPHGFPALPSVHLRTPKEVSDVYLPPYVASQLAQERQREMVAQAQRQRRGRQLAAVARASRRAERAERQMRRAVRLALQLRAELPQ